MKKVKPKIPTQDLYLAAFLSGHGFEPELTINAGKVLFLFPEIPEVQELVESFRRNAKIGISDYLVTLRRLRTKMFSFKDQAMFSRRAPLAEEQEGSP